jgi:hypothetical protein
MGGTDRCGILFYAGSITTGVGLLLVALAPNVNNKYNHFRTNFPLEWWAKVHTEPVYKKFEFAGWISSWIKYAQNT